MLNIVEGYDLAALDPEGPDAVHLMAEAKKLAFADRLAYMGDVPDAPLAALLSKEHAERQRRRIDLDRAATHVSPGRLRAGSETTSLCVVDARGNAVSLIQSVFHGFGSGVVVPGTGVLLNNRMTGFSLDPKHPNALAPGKRPMHTLNTWMLFQGDDALGPRRHARRRRAGADQRADHHPDDRLEARPAGGHRKPQVARPARTARSMWKTVCPWKRVTNCAGWGTN